MLQGQRGECCNFQPDDVEKSNILIDLILLWLSVDSRTVLLLREGSRKAIAEGACALERSPMRWQHPIVLFVGLCGAGWGFLCRLFPLLEENPLLDLVAPPSAFFYKQDSKPGSSPHFALWWSLMMGGFLLLSAYR